MNATVITTGPGVIMATATASKNCRTVSPWKRVTTPTWRRGTIGRPLPNTNAPASAKYQPIVVSVAAEAGASTPVIAQSGKGPTPSRLVTAAARGGALTAIARRPLTTNTQITSDSV